MGDELDAAGDERRRDVAGLLDGVERRDHPDDGPEEPEHRGERDPEAEPDEPALEEAHLD